MFDRIAVIFTICHLFIHSVRSDCPPDSVIEPCYCVIAIPSHTYQLYNDYNPEAIITQQKSIVCEHVPDPSFDLATVFSRLSAFLAENETAFDSFLLFNTSTQHIPAQVFSNITFSALMFQDTPRLTTIDANAFDSSKDHVEIFETLNTNLSDSETLFSMLRQFGNLRRLSMHNDRLTSIPAYAFNQPNLVQIWFGLENRRTSQPIETIGEYAFYNLPKLRLLRLFSPNLTQINKYALAQRNRSLSSDALNIFLGGQRINSSSFPLTSLTRFRSRAVNLRLYFTSLTHLEESVFQPFLETHPATILDINTSNTLFKCDCRSAWVQLDYQRNLDKVETRVTGYPCWNSNFTSCVLKEK